MKIFLLKLTMLMAAIILLPSCATNGVSNQTVASTDTTLTPVTAPVYSRSITTNSYMYRSPPPGAVMGTRR